LSGFNKHRLRKDGLDSKCRQCNADAGKNWYRRRQADTNRLYSTYIGMKGRCHSPSHSNYPAYGGRGISVCDEWRQGFAAFAEWAVKNGYRPDMQLDRIDNNKGYSPENCRFVTISENMRNKRPRDVPLRNNARLTIEDVKAIKQLLAQGISQREIGRRFGIRHATVWAIKIGRTWADVTVNPIPSKPGDSDAIAELQRQ
jgi:predicted DNA-binding protein (UPF0251 family)